MKNKNLFLFVFLILGIIFTYFFEEMRNQKKDEEIKKELSLIPTYGLEKLQSIQGIKLSILKKGELFYSAENGLLLSGKKLDEFFKILSGLQVKSIVPKEELAKVDRSFFIANEDLKLNFSFLDEKVQFSLGKKLGYDQRFYMEVVTSKGGVSTKKMVVVEDQSVDPNAYSSEEEYKKSDFKYQRLQMMFYLTNVFFYESAPFHQFHYDPQTLHFKTMEIATFRNKKFSLNFEKTETLPPILSGLKYFEENWISFYRSLVNIEAKTVYFPYDEKKLEGPLSEFIIHDRDQRKIVLTLFKKYGSLTGYFLKTDFNKILYELRAEDSQYFFVNIQDFWQKKIGPISSQYSLKLLFPNQASAVEMLVQDDGLFKATSRQGIINVAQLKKLLDLLKTNADHVSEVLNEKWVMKLYFENRELDVILIDNEVVFVDPVYKWAMHYYTGKDIPFSILRSDYIK